MVATAVTARAGTPKPDTTPLKLTHSGPAVFVSVIHQIGADIEYTAVDSELGVRFAINPNGPSRADHKLWANVTGDMGSEHLLHPAIPDVPAEGLSGQTAAGISVQQQQQHPPQSQMQQQPQRPNQPPQPPQPPQQQQQPNQPLQQQLPPQPPKSQQKQQQPLEIRQIVFGSSPKPVTVCRLYNVCRDAAGVLYTSPSNDSGQTAKVRNEDARKLAIVASTKCGRAISSTTTDVVQSVDFLHSISDKDVLFGGITSGSGEKSTVFRYHMPHFMTDFLPAFIGWDSLMQLFTQAPANRGNTSWFASNGSSVDVPLDEDRSPTLDGIILMEDRFSLQASTSQWVGKFLDMVPLEPVIRRRVQPAQPDTGLVCFRSGVMVPKLSAFVDKYMENVATPDRPNDFFSRNSLQRHRLPAPQCKLRVAILNREYFPGAGRNFPNVDQIVQEIRRLPTNFSRYVKLDVEVFYMSSLSFSEQRRAMQFADIIVSVHGAELTNLVFARSAALLIEVMPYSYPAGIFGDLAKKMGIEYHSVIALPDVPGFSDCVRKFNKDEISIPAIALFAERAANAEVSGKFDNFDATAGLLLPDLVFQHQCARSQRLSPDIDLIRNLIKQFAQSNCPT